MTDKTDDELRALARDIIDATAGDDDSGVNVIARYALQSLDAPGPRLTGADSIFVEQLRSDIMISRAAKISGEPLEAVTRGLMDRFAEALDIIDRLSAQPKETGKVIELRAALRNMADAYVRKVKTNLTADEIAKEPWRCAEYIEAERLCKTAFKLQFTKEWLLDKIKSDPDLPCEVGPYVAPEKAEGETP